MQYVVEERTLVHEMMMMLDLADAALTVLEFYKFCVILCRLIQTLYLILYEVAQDESY